MSQHTNPFLSPTHDSTSEELIHGLEEIALLAQGDAPHSQPQTPHQQAPQLQPLENPFQSPPPTTQEVTSGVKGLARLFEGAASTSSTSASLQSSPSLGSLPTLQDQSQPNQLQAGSPSSSGRTSHQNTPNRSPRTNSIPSNRTPESKSTTPTFLAPTSPKRGTVQSLAKSFEQQSTFIKTFESSSSRASEGSITPLTASGPTSPRKASTPSTALKLLETFAEADGDELPNDDVRNDDVPTEDAAEMRDGYLEENGIAEDLGNPFSDSEEPVEPPSHSLDSSGHQPTQSTDLDIDKLEMLLQKNVQITKSDPSLSDKSSNIFGLSFMSSEESLKTSGTSVKQTPSSSSNMDKSKPQPSSISSSNPFTGSPPSQLPTPNFTVTNPSPERPPLPPRPPSQAPSQASSSTNSPKLAPVTLVAPPPLPDRPVRVGSMTPQTQSSQISLGGQTPPMTTTSSQQISSIMSLPSQQDTFTPNSISANRSLPLPTSLSNNEIMHKGPIKCFATSGFKLVTANNNIRVFYTPTGEQTKTISLGELKITAIQFPPAYYPEDEGIIAWVSVEKGDIYAIDIEHGNVVERGRAHNSTVISMLRALDAIWTIDEHGTVMIWKDYSTTATLLSSSSSSSNANGNGNGAGQGTTSSSPRIISLYSRPKFMRISQRPQCCFVSSFNDELWVSYGKLIEVYSLSDGLIKKVDIKNTAGVVTAFAASTHGASYTSSKPDASSIPSGSSSPQKMVFSGHDDGKIIAWDMITKTRLFTVHATVYRICSMTIGNDNTHLWVGFSTGKIYIYDISQMPWITLKDFEAHKGQPVVDLQWNLKSLYMAGATTSPVIASLGESGIIRLWDGLLTHDWTTRALKRVESSYCTYQVRKVLIGSWNIDAHKPSDLDEGTAEDVRFLGKWLRCIDKPDIVVIGMQEIVDLESKKVNAKSIFNLSSTNTKSQQQSPDTRAGLWKDRLVKALRECQPDRSYEIVETRNMVGLFSLIFIASDISNRIRDVSVSMVKTGLGGLHGNKGGIAVRFLMDDSSMCFVNCHLAAHQNQVNARNSDAAAILSEANFKMSKSGTDGSSATPLSTDCIYVNGGDGGMILDHEIVFFYGDLNYRIDLPREEVISLVKLHKDYKKLMDFDQLKRQLHSNPNFLLRGFSEALTLFDPTFKYDRFPPYEYDTSEKRRIPAWCDRILWRGPLEQLSYNRYETTISDHRPISATFEIRTKIVNASSRVSLLKDVQARCQEYLLSRLESRKVEWVTKVCGVDMNRARELVKEHGDVRVIRDYISSSNGN